MEADKSIKGLTAKKNSRAIISPFGLRGKLKINDVKPFGGKSLNG